MYWLGWEMGAVEAISLSILVGSSVDYCLHLVEGYLLAGEGMAATPGHNLVWQRQFSNTLCTHTLKQSVTKILARSGPKDS